MKYLLCTLSFLFLTSTVDAQKKVNWMSWGAAMTAAETSPKKIYIDIYTDWCSYCKKMDKTTFKDPSVVKYLNDNFYPVKFNAEQKESINFNETDFKYISSGSRGVHELAAALLNGNLGYPAFVVLDEEFARILISPGYKEADAVMMEMKFANEEKYKTTTWNSYMAQYNTVAKPVAVDRKPANTARPVNATQGNQTNTRSANGRQDTIPRKTVPPPPPPPPMPEEEEEIFKVVEDMPRFPGCEGQDLDKNDIQNCAREKMLEYIYNNLDYPKLARENGVEGTTVVQFVVDKAGIIKDARIVRDIGAGCGDVALNLVNKMPNWVPGKQRGRPVNVLYTLPVKFKLKEEVVEPPAGTKIESPKVTKGINGQGASGERVYKSKAAAKEALSREAASQETATKEGPKKRDAEFQEGVEGEIFKVVEEMPRFPGCEESDETRKEKTKCSEQKMLEFIYKNLEYPAAAREKGLDGMVVIQFVVDKNGVVRNAKILRELGEGCGDAALKVVNQMPNWKPGMQRGAPVDVLYTLPVRFKLEKGKSKKKIKDN